MIDESRLYAHVGKRIKELREGDGGRLPRRTQAQVAYQIGLERTSITNIEKGDQKVPLHVLYRICSVLGADISAILPPLSDVQAENWSSEHVGALGEVTLPPMAVAALKRVAV